MSESTPAAATAAANDAPNTNPTASADSSTASSSSSQTASNAATASSSSTAPSSLHLIPAERNDFYVGAPLYVRQQPVTCTLVDWPHVYWRSAGMGEEQQKHRSFSDCRDIFSIDERDRGKKAERRDALPHSATTHGALPGLLLSTGGGGGGSGGGLVDDDDDEDDDDDDDEPFTVAAVTAVLKPALAKQAIAAMEERRSPKNSPKNRPTSTAHLNDSSSGGSAEGKSEEQSQPVDSDS